MIKQLNLGNSTGLAAGVLTQAITRPAIWTVVAAMKICWVRVTAVRTIIASGGIVRSDAEFFLGSTGLLNDTPPGFVNIGDLAPSSIRSRYGVETGFGFCVTPPIQAGAVLDLNMLFYNFGTPAAGDSLTWECAIGYEDVK